MNQEFFKKLKGKEVSVDYNQGSKHSFIEGEVLKVAELFVSIANDACMVSLTYPSITSVRIMTNKETGNPKPNHDRERLEQQQEEHDRTR